MAETWLRTNTRVFRIAAIGPALAVVAGGVLASGWLSQAGWLRWTGAIVAIMAALLSIAIVAQSCQPRLACDQRRLLIYLGAGAPFRVPLDAVQCFLLGRGPSWLPGRHASAETATVVVRLSEKDEQWSQQPVKPALGSWCGHQVTIRGTWCEPLGIDVVQRLNDRLAAAQKKLRERAEVAP